MTLERISHLLFIAQQLHELAESQTFPSYFSCKEQLSSAISKAITKFINETETEVTTQTASNEIIL